MSKEQIKAARRKQAGNYAILFRTILPNVVSPVWAALPLKVVRAILSESSLSFLGVGLRTPEASWGNMAQCAMELVNLTTRPWAWIPPGLCIVATALALAFALVLVKKFRGRTFFRGVFYFPCVVAPIAVAIIWRWMYNADFGFINSLMEALGIDYAQTWLSNPKTSLLALFAAALWQMVGEPMIFFLAGLQAVPSELYDAALVDGATPAQKFFYVTLPMIKETFVIVIATLVINAVHVYDIVQGLTNGGPNNATQVLSTYMYTQTFRYNNLGYGAAISIVMVLMMMVIVVPYIIATTKED